MPDSPPAPLSFAGLPVADDRATAYRLLHERGPVARLASGDFVVVAREQVEFALRHPELFSSRLAFAGVGSPLPMVPIEFDPPEHSRYRRLLHPFFSPRAILPLHRTVTALAGELIDGLIDAGRCDFVADVAVPLPADVFLTLFGLPLADRERLIAWKNTLSGPVVVSGGKAPPAQAAKAASELHAYLLSHLGRLRANPGVLGPLTGRLTDEELLGLTFQFALAGLDTVASALGNAFATLGGRPDLRRRIAEDPGAVPALVEELLRHDGPVFVVPRVSVEEITLGGVTIPEGARVFVTISPANRDPSSYADPDAVNAERERPHLAFGVGPHRCVGSHLARLEMRSVFHAWHRRIPDYRLAPGAELLAPWPNGLVGVSSVPLEFPP